MPWPSMRKPGNTLCRFSPTTSSSSTKRIAGHRAGRGQADEPVHLGRERDQPVHRRNVVLSRCSLSTITRPMFGMNGNGCAGSIASGVSTGNTRSMNQAASQAAVRPRAASRDRTRRSPPPPAGRAARARRSAAVAISASARSCISPSCWAGVRPSARQRLHAGLRLAHQPGDADGEELVEVGGADRDEAQPLQQRMGGVLRLLHHAVVEVQPGQFAVDEPVRTAGRSMAIPDAGIGSLRRRIRLDGADLVRRVGGSLVTEPGRAEVSPVMSVINSGASWPSAQRPAPRWPASPGGECPSPASTPHPARTRPGAARRDGAAGGAAASPASPPALRELARGEQAGEQVRSIASPGWSRSRRSRWRAGGWRGRAAGWPSGTGPCGPPAGRAGRLSAAAFSRCSRAVRARDRRRRPPGRLGGQAQQPGPGPGRGSRPRRRGRPRHAAGASCRTRPRPRWPGGRRARRPRRARQASASALLGSGRKSAGCVGGLVREGQGKSGRCQVGVKRALHWSFWRRVRIQAGCVR